MIGFSCVVVTLLSLPFCLTYCAFENCVKVIHSRRFNEHNWLGQC